MYFESLEAVIKVLTELRNFSLSRRQKKEKIFTAVEAIIIAANRTKYYYSTLHVNREEPNIELSEYWLKAASAVRDLDNNLYERLLLKADFWSNPDNWTQEMSAESKIYLDQIINDSRNILKLK